MRRVSRILIAIVAVIGVTACNSRELLTAEEYVRFMERDGNGFRKQVKTGTYNYTFQYKSPEYIMLKEQRGNQTTVADKRLHQLDSTVWFNVMIHTGSKINPLKADAGSLGEYNKRMNYFLSDAVRNFKLTYGDQGEMKCIGYLFENNYGLTPMDVMIIGYRIPDKRAAREMQLTYDDELFDYGPVKVTISAEKLTSIPKLKI